MKSRPGVFLGGRAFDGGEILASIVAAVDGQGVFCGWEGETRSLECPQSFFLVLLCGLLTHDVNGTTLDEPDGYGATESNEGYGQEGRKNRMSFDIFHVFSLLDGGSMERTDFYYGMFPIKEQGSRLCPLDGPVFF